MCKDSLITAEDQLRTKGLNKRRNSRGDLILNNNFILWSIIPHKVKDVILKVSKLKVEISPKKNNLI